MPFYLPDIKEASKDIKFNYEKELSTIRKETGLNSLWEAVNTKNVLKTAAKGVFTKEGRKDASQIFSILQRIAQRKQGVELGQEKDYYGNGVFDDPNLTNSEALASGFSTLRDMEKKYDILDDKHEARIFDFGERMDASTARTFTDKYNDFLKRYGLLK